MATTTLKKSVTTSEVNEIVQQTTAGTTVLTITAGTKFTVDSKAYKYGKLCFVGIKAVATAAFDATDVIATVGSSGLPTAGTSAILTIRIRDTSQDFIPGYARVETDGNIKQLYTGTGRSGDIYYMLFIYNTI